MPARHSPAMSEVLESIGAWLEQTLAAGRACGAIRDDLPPSLQITLVGDILRSLDRWSLHHLHEYPVPERADLTRAQIEILRRLLAPCAPRDDAFPRSGSPESGSRSARSASRTVSEVRTSDYRWLVVRAEEE